MDIPTMWKYFMAVYREGYDEIIVKFDPKKIYETPLRVVVNGVNSGIVTTLIEELLVVTVSCISA
jgi:hypothetical protein